MRRATGCIRRTRPPTAGPPAGRRRSPREIYLRVHEELPYALGLDPAFEERAAGSALIEQTSYVERDGQRAIVLGKCGEVDQVDRKTASEELEEILDRRSTCSCSSSQGELVPERGLSTKWGLDSTSYRPLAFPFSPAKAGTTDPS